MTDSDADPRAELRAEALAAAREITAEEGLRGLGARRVARAIGVSPGTIYNLFADLDDLVDRMNAGTLEALDRACREAAPDGTPGLEALARAYLGFARAHPNLYAALFEHRRPPPGRPPEWFAEKVDALLALVERALAAEGRADTAPLDALVLWSAMHGIAMLAVTDKLGPGDPAPHLAERLVDMARGAAPGGGGRPDGFLSQIMRRSRGGG